MFSDLNKYAIKPTKSLNILYDHRSEFAQATVSLLDDVPIFKGLTNLEKTSISNRSNKVFTLNNVYHANCALLGKRSKHPQLNNEDRKTMITYWSEVYNNILEWQDVVNQKISAYELRKKYVHGQGVLLVALGKIGNHLLNEHKDTWNSKLELLKNVTWTRDNKEWQDRAIVNGKISKSQTSLKLTVNLIKSKLGINLTNIEKELEKKINRGT